MKIDSTIFGAITIDGKTYQHDVVVRLSGEGGQRDGRRQRHSVLDSHLARLPRRPCSQSGAAYANAHAVHSRLHAGADRHAIQGGGHLGLLIPGSLSLVSRTPIRW